MGERSNEIIGRLKQEITQKDAVIHQMKMREINLESTNHKMTKIHGLNGAHTTTDGLDTETNGDGIGFIDSMLNSDGDGQSNDDDDDEMYDVIAVDGDGHT